MTERRGFLIVSDLHLSEGRDPQTGWINPREDFLFDDDFADFLEFHTAAGKWVDYRWTLILAGDFVDFLQVTDEPDDRADLVREGDYGLVAGPGESAWKMERIMAGHPVFFKALSRFAARHRIIFVSGNHDAELFYPEAREAIISGLKELSEESQEGPQKSLDIEFRPWFWFQEGIYVEHGHQYDSFNSLPSPLDPIQTRSSTPAAEEAKSIYFSLGSIFVRYLFNRVETSSPFADNIKPPTKFIGWFVRHHPLRAISFMFTDGGKMLDAIRRLAAGPAEAGTTPIQETAETTDGHDCGADFIQQLRNLQKTPFLMQLEGIRKGIFLLLARKWVILGALLILLVLNLASLAALLSPLWSLLVPAELAETEIIEQTARWTRDSQAPLIFFLFQAAFWVIFHLVLRQYRKRHDCSGYLRARAAEISKILHPEYIVMGHCHRIDLQRLPSGCHYVNTGTWTKIFSHESAAVREEKEFTYTRIISVAGEKTMDLMKWQGKGGTGRRANLIIS